MNETTSNESGTVHPTSAAQTSTKPGWLTSEFWMTALGHVGLVLAAAGGLLPAKYAVVAAAASQVAYSLSRGLAKGGIAAAAR